MREEFAAEGPEVILSRPLRSALDLRLAQGEQAIVLLNRRGYAAAVVCRQCGGTLECPNCSVSLTVHFAARQARCHYCDHAVRVPEHCGSCGADYVEYVGIGTERVEAEVATRFPGVRIARVDRDTVRRRGAIVSILDRFAAREVDVLVGTQMLAKGHDFPAVTLVGVISADVGLGLADFRAAERTFQLLTQVAGRAGRGDRRGEAIIQTLVPEHYSIRFARTQDYAGFFEAETAFRRGLRYPPFVSLVNVVITGRTAREALADAGLFAADLRRFAAPAVTVLGPAVAPLQRLRGDHRAQCFLKSTDRRAMRDAVRRALAARPAIARRATVDVDPLTML
jgi:primosomal protein N' (replication factor Y)